MANKTVYPYGTGGRLPSNIGLVDFTVGGRDKALDAESGKILHQMILQHTDTYASIAPQNTYKAATAQGAGKIVDSTTGEITDSAYTANFVNEFPIDLVSNEYLASYGYGSLQTENYSLNYYDAEWNFLGGAYRNPGSQPATYLEMAELVYPDSWQSDLDTFKATAKYVRISGYTGSRKALLYEWWTIPASVLPQPATPGAINIFVSTIRSPQLRKYTNNQTEIVTNSVSSPWGIVWPESYSISGNPTPVIAMLHGASGYVAEDCLGYTNQYWTAWRDAFLSAGFAVMDVNGWGISSEADEHSKHWGCPLAVETLDRAFEFLKQNYNVCGKLLLHGLSMGANLAMSYAKAHPGKVSAVGVFAPNFLAYSARFNPSITKYTSWGYADQAEAEANGFNEYAGFVPLAECQVADDETGAISQFEWSDYDSTTKEEILTKRLIDHFPVQIRIWQGSLDTDVPMAHSVLLYQSLIRGNSPVSLRICDRANHSLETYEYVRNEAVDYFKRFAVQQP